MNTDDGLLFHARDYDYNFEASRAACDWVRENTDNTLFEQPHGVVVRVSAQGYVWLLTWDTIGLFYRWDRLRDVT